MRVFYICFSLRLWLVIVNGRKASFFFYSRLNHHQSNMKQKHITKRKSIELPPKCCSHSKAHLLLVIK